MAKIDGIQLPADLSGSLGGTPEEAAKVFLSAASKGLAKVDLLHKSENKR